MGQVRVALFGVGGRMGGALVAASRAHTEISLVAGIEHQDSPLVGRDIGELDAGGELECLIIGDLAELPEVDVLIDFTRPAPALTAYEYCATHGIAVVTGTTGFSEAEQASIEKFANDIPFIQAANFSVGVNLALRLSSLAASTLGEDYDIEIVETHHKHKVDAPSGTALALGESVAKARGKDLIKDGVYSRHGHTGEREQGSIGFQTLRGGDVVGDHTVMFLADGERVEISHRASSRATFAKGALRAAAWLNGKQTGRYSMSDVLGF